MNLLLDTHLLIWATDDRYPLTAEAASLIDDTANALIFSAASIWEVAIKTAQGRPDFRLDPHVLRRALLDNGYTHLPVTADHGAAVADLPAIHKDPFDRILVAQARVEGFTLLTADKNIARYPGPVRLVG